jgi:hypothetical protein
MQEPRQNLPKFSRARANTRNPSMNQAAPRQPYRRESTIASTKVAVLWTKKDVLGIIMIFYGYIKIQRE